MLGHFEESSLRVVVEGMSKVHLQLLEEVGQRQI